MLGMGEALAPNEYYNYMTETWRDGTPFTAAGQGYNPWNPIYPPAENAFPGYPDSIGLWTELNAKNPLGNRRALLNFGLGVAPIKSINRLTLMYSYMPAEAGTLTHRIQNWEKKEEDLMDRLFCCVGFNAPDKTIGCEYGIHFFHEPSVLAIFPNPANDILQVWHPDIHLKTMRLFNTLGQVVGIGFNQGRYSEMQVQNLPQGIYFLDVETDRGEQKIETVIVAH